MSTWLCWSRRQLLTPAPEHGRLCCGLSGCGVVTLQRGRACSGGGWRGARVSRRVSTSSESTSAAAAPAPPSPTSAHPAPGGEAALQSDDSPRGLPPAGPCNPHPPCHLERHHRTSVSSPEGDTMKENV